MKRRETESRAAQWSARALTVVGIVESVLQVALGAEDVDVDVATLLQVDVGVEAAHVRQLLSALADGEDEAVGERLQLDVLLLRLLVGCLATRGALEEGAPELPVLGLVQIDHAQTDPALFGRKVGLLLLLLRRRSGGSSSGLHAPGPVHLAAHTCKQPQGDMRRLLIKLLFYLSVLSYLEARTNERNEGGEKI